MLIRRQPQPPIRGHGLEKASFAEGTSAPHALHSWTSRCPTPSVQAARPLSQGTPGCTGLVRAAAARCRASRADAPHRERVRFGDAARSWPSLYAASGPVACHGCPWRRGHRSSMSGRQAVENVAAQRMPGGQAGVPPCRRRAAPDLGTSRPASGAPGHRVQLGVIRRALSPPWRVAALRSGRSQLGAGLLLALEPAVAPLWSAARQLSGGPSDSPSG